MPTSDVWVRVRLANGAEASIRADAAEAAGLTPLKKPAVRRDGRPLPIKLRVLTKKAAATQPTTSTPEASPVSDAPQEG